MDKAFLKMLACPVSLAPLLEDGDRLVSTDPKTRLAYPIKDGFPSLVVDDGVELSEDEHADILQRHGATPYQKKANQ